MKSSTNDYYRRRLPHYQPEMATFFVTFRLIGSLPDDVLARLIAERDFNERLIANEKDKQKREKMMAEERKRYFGHFDSFLDKARLGNNWLAESKIADLVAEAILYRDGKGYDLLAFCIMPNHVHLVIYVDQSISLAEESPESPNMGDSASHYIVTELLGSLKKYTALRANRLLKRFGAFWQHESYDHVVRNDDELERVIEYVAYNPVKAKLCRDWRDWKWTYVKAGLVDL